MTTFLGEARVTICRVHDNFAKDSMRIEIKDQASRSTAVVIVMSMEEFAYALTACAEREATVRWMTDLVGKKREHKTMLVPFERPVTERYPDDPTVRTPSEAIALASFETDGWEGRPNDLRNHHNWDSKLKAFRVAFERYV